MVFEVRNAATGDPPNRRALFLIDVDGTGLRQLTDWSLNGGDSPDWSPNGKLILFRALSTTNREGGNLHTIRPDGSGLKKLTDYPPRRTVQTGSFSPDGKWITFTRFTDTPHRRICHASRRQRHPSRLTRQRNLRPRLGTPAETRQALALVTARVEAEAGLLAALLEVVVASSRLDRDDALL